jgi:ribonuclease BN (tRNA processing enzyme)
MMRFTVLGTGTIALSPARRCAGYLVECGAVRLLLDCGPGTAHRLAELGLQWRDLTHVAITHFHLDHHLDLPLLLFAWRHGMLPARTAPLTIIGPPGIAGLLERLSAVHGDWVRDPGYPVTVTELARDGRMELEPGVSLEALPVPHTDESVAYSIGCAGRRLVYTGDTGHSPELATWARDADLLVAECSLPQAMAIPGHLTPELCGQLAAAARPRHLVLTHLYPPVEAVDIVAAVRRHFDGLLTVAHDGWTTTLEDG